MRKILRTVALVAIVGTVAGTSLCFAARGSRKTVKNGGVETTEEANLKRAYANGYKLGYEKDPPAGATYASGYSDKTMDSEWNKGYAKGKEDRKTGRPDSNPYASYLD